MQYVLHDKENLESKKVGDFPRLFQNLEGIRSKEETG
jgi:hypothetical protein